MIPPLRALSMPLVLHYPKGTTVEALDIPNRLVASMDFGNAYAGLQQSGVRDCAYRPPASMSVRIRTTTFLIGSGSPRVT